MRLDNIAVFSECGSVTYPGGKAGAGVYQTLINLMPPHEVYIEPFLGAGAVMRFKRRARLNIGIDRDRAALELAMGVPSVEWAIAPAKSPDRAMPPGWRAPSPLLTVSADSTGNGEARRLKSSRVAMVDPDSAGFADTFRSGDGSSFEFMEGDGIQFLKCYPFTGRELVYCDPPYLMETRSGRRLYKFEMDKLEHRRLLRVVMALPCMVMISGYWSKMYAETLKGWNSASYTAVTRGGRVAKEWVWFNFAAPAALHDYRYLGSTFRERERIKRKKTRWVSRLQRMDLLERQALLSAISDSGVSGDAS